MDPQVAAFIQQLQQSGGGLSGAVGRPGGGNMAAPGGGGLPGMGGGVPMPGGGGGMPGVMGGGGSRGPMGGLGGMAGGQWRNMLANALGSGSMPAVGPGTPGTPR